VTAPNADLCYLSTCPSCQKQIDVTSLEPFTKLGCPFCGQMVRVRRKFDQFMIIKQIGEGGMSRVFEAEDETLGRRVALKILNSRFSRDAARIEQFRQEALITAKVNHPNVIKLYSVGHDQGYFYIAMELVSGGSLDQRIRRETKLPEKDALRIGREVAEGLRAAEQMGLIHRDVKPANILFTETGIAKVVDFGLAIFADRHTDPSLEIWATPYYVAPEKLLEQREDYRSDIFSLGATLYHALTGQPPHRADTHDYEQLRMIKCRRIDLEDSGISFQDRTIHVINRMAAFRPQERCSDYDETVDELRLAEVMLSRGYSRRQLSRRLRWTLSTAAALALAFSIGWTLQFSRQKRANAITDKVETTRKELTGEGVTLTAGTRRTVAERFLDARELMLKKQQFAEALHQFEKLIEVTEIRQPTLNWTRFNAALCHLALGRKEQAIRHFQAIENDPGQEKEGVVGPSLVTPQLARFFHTLGQRLGQNLSLGKPTAELQYALNHEAILGYLAHGLAEWHFGDPQLGAHHMLHFKEHLDQLKDSTSSSATSPQNWVPQYREIIDFYADRIQRVLAMPPPAPFSTVEAGRQNLKQLQLLLQENRQPPRVRAMLENWEKQTRQRLAEIHLSTWQRELRQSEDQRQTERQQWHDLLDTLNALAANYDFKTINDLLNSLHFDTPDVQRALESQRYLFSQAETAFEQTLKDLQRQPYTGPIRLNTNRQELHGTLSFTPPHELALVIAQDQNQPAQERRFSRADISAQTWLTLAESHIHQQRDSTLYYQRKEQLIAFAHVCGLRQHAEHLIRSLTTENSDFRQRWASLSF
jgi:serine/threonine protein kinase